MLELERLTKSKVNQEQFYYEKQRVDKDIMTFKELEQRKAEEVKQRQKNYKDYIDQ